MAACLFSACLQPFGVGTPLGAGGTYYLERTFGQPYSDGSATHLSPGLALWMTDGSPKLQALASSVLEVCPAGVPCPGAPAVVTLRLTVRPEDSPAAPLLDEVPVPQFVFMEHMDAASVQAAVEALALARLASSPAAVAAGVMAGDAIEVPAFTDLGLPATADPQLHPGVPALFGATSRRVEVYVTTPAGDFVDPYLYLDLMGADASVTALMDTTPPVVQSIHVYPDGAAASELTAGPNGRIALTGPVDIVAVIRDVGPPVCFAASCAAPDTVQQQSIAVPEITYEIVREGSGTVVLPTETARLYCTAIADHTEDGSLVDDPKVGFYFHPAHMPATPAGGLPFVLTNMRERPLSSCVPPQYLATGSAHGGFIDPACLGAGDHRIRVQARDHAGLQSALEEVAITVGGSSSLAFTDVSRASGIGANNVDPTPPTDMKANSHSRVAVADFDGDGWDDIVMHSTRPNAKAGLPYTHRVMRNKGDGTFEDKAAAWGLETITAGYFVMGDVDNDGDQDIFAGLDTYDEPDELAKPTDNWLSGKTHQILLNELASSGKFVPAPTSDLNKVSPTTSANAAFADFDNDGKLDLYLGQGHSGTFVLAADAVLFGKGDGRFTTRVDLTGAANNGENLNQGMVLCDYDDDGDQDVFVGTYSASAPYRGQNVLWEVGAGPSPTFTDVGRARGFAYLNGGNPILPFPGGGVYYNRDQKDWVSGSYPDAYIGSNAFGVDCGDVDNDGDLDVLMGTVSHPYKPNPPAVPDTYAWTDGSQLLLNQGAAGTYAFKDAYAAKELPFHEGQYDAALADFDNDGRLDIAFTRADRYHGRYTAKENQGGTGLFRQQSDGSFESLTATSGINNPSHLLTASRKDPDELPLGCPSGEASNGTECRRPCQGHAICPSTERCDFKDGTSGFCEWNTGASHDSCSPSKPCTSGERCVHLRCLTSCDAAKPCASPLATCDYEIGYCKPLKATQDGDGIGWLDYDRDGDLDIVIGAGGAGPGGRPNFLLRNDVGNCKTWIGFRVEGNGTTVNRDGIGTRLTLVYPGGTRQVREIKSSRGHYSSADSRVAHFGLGDLGGYTQLHVRWPDGTTHIFPASTLVERRVMKLSYPDRLAVE